MATKTISIMEDVHSLLVRNKHKGESFSDELRRLLKNKGSILDCAGLWSDLSDRQVKEIKDNIKKSRDYTKEHIKERLR